ncbi:YwaF family protein [Mycoplasma phocoenae]|uniref:YwaF family protein n=1 Tax=Mycoplasma phocoenae TaxID=754517 RepID=A0A858U406_9MOLU|nr:YwaF family protein [Mycoplasma phocoenae]QJG67200.1 YwaF family protein [Mycoplasma phocoenae]
MKTLLSNNINDLTHRENYGFFAWFGGYSSFDESRWLFITLFVVFFLLLFSFILFRKPIVKKYQLCEKILYMNKATFWKVSGFIALMFVLFRCLFLFMTDWPAKWESIPLHFCRLCIIAISVLMLLNKLHLIKYVFFFCLLGGTLAVLFCDLNNNPIFQNQNQGYPIHYGWDSYIFWDYVLAHFYVFAGSIIPFILTQEKISKKDFLKIQAIFTSMIIFFFILNYLTTFLPNKKWWANWFYLGISEVNTLQDIFPPLTKWPITFITGSVISLIGFIPFILMYWLVSMFGVEKNDNNKYVFKIYRENSFTYFKQSKFLN